MPEQIPVRCSILRGGTSRAIFFKANDLPPSREKTEQLLLNVFGSPDIREIDGLGGATSQTSKAAIIGAPSRPDADVDYSFAQVVVDKPTIDWGGNCGNISSAVGPYAINSGLVRAVEPITTVRVHNTNTAKIILEHVPVVGGRAASTGTYVVPGVPFPAARILLEFASPGGSVTGKLLPTGRPIDTITLADGRTFDGLDRRCGQSDGLLSGHRPGCDRDRAAPRRSRPTRRCATCSRRGAASLPRWLGLVKDRRDGTRLSPGLPKVGFVARPQAYRTTAGVDMSEDDMDLTRPADVGPDGARARTWPPARSAPVLPPTIEGTIVDELVRPDRRAARCPTAIRIAPSVRRDGGGRQRRRARRAPRRSGAWRSAGRPATSSTARSGSRARSSIPPRPTRERWEDAAKPQPGAAPSMD